MYVWVAAAETWVCGFICIFAYYFELVAFG